MLLYKTLHRSLIKLEASIFNVMEEEEMKRTLQKHWKGTESGSAKRRGRSKMLVLLPEQEYLASKARK